MKVLLTGFGPFDSFDENPSQMLVDRLLKLFSGPGIDAEQIVLPVVFGEAREKMSGALKEKKPDISVCFGLNPYIGHFNVEEIGLNIRSSEVADNSGALGDEGPVERGGTLALRSSLPVSDIVSNLRKNGIPARRSFSAGTYLCNEVLYTTLSWCEENGSKGGFVHIPMSTELIAGNIRRYRAPHMSMETIERGGRIIVETCMDKY